MSAPLDSAAWIVELVHGDSLGARMIVNACARRILDEAEASRGAQFKGLIAATHVLGRIQGEISALGKDASSDPSLVTPGILAELEVSR